jgi:DNA-binding GntR family transcriptional regulator
MRDISTESIDVGFHIRGKLEGLCVRYLREHLNREDEEALRDCLKKMKAASTAADNEQFLQADMRLHQTIWKLSRREQLYRTLNSVMNTFIFMVARTYSSQTPIAERYKHHQDYLNIVLTSPVSRVERRVEQYFEELHHQLFRNQSPFLGPNGDAWLSDANLAG